jgi:hypothetical protein
MIIGDSTVVTFNTYDNGIYAIGMGPSQTNVEAPLAGVTQGQSVIIRGTVMDISPGTTDPDIAIRFPNGVAAVSDADMTDWMTYVYNQFPAQVDAEGVDVFIKIQDPNGDYHSATVTTNADGTFSYMWAPEVVGEYMVTAMFEGSKSYFASQATTTFGVDEAPPTEDSQEVDLSSVEDRIDNQMMYILAILAIVIIALLIAIYSLMKSK